MDQATLKLTTVGRFLCSLLLMLICCFVMAKKVCLAQETKLASLNWQTLNLPEAHNSPSALSLSYDGRVAAHITSRGEIIVWDALSTKVLERIPPNYRNTQTNPKVESPQNDNPRQANVKNLPSAIALNLDGSEIAIGYLNARIAIYSLKNKTLTQELKGHTGAISALTFSHSNQILASGSEDGTTQIWQLKTGQRLHVFDSQFYGDISSEVGTPVAINFYDNDHRLVVNEWYRGHYDVGRRASIWELENGLEIETLHIAPPNNDDFTRAGMAVNSRTWQLVYTGDWINQKHGLMVKNLDTCDEAQQLKVGGYADTVAIDPRGRWYASIDNVALSLMHTASPKKPTLYQSPGRVIALLPDASGDSMLALVLIESEAADNAASAQTSAYGEYIGRTQVKRVRVPNLFLRDSQRSQKNSAQACPISQDNRAIQTFSTPNPAPKLRLKTTLAAPAAMMEKLADNDLNVFPSPVVELFFNTNEQLMVRHLGYDDSSHPMRSGIVQWDLNDKKILRANFKNKFEESSLIRGKTTWYQAYENPKNLLTDEEIKTINNTETSSRALYVNTRFDPESGLFFKWTDNTIEVFDDKGKHKDSLKLKGKILNFAVRNGRLAVLFNGNRVYLWESGSKQAKTYKLDFKLDEYDSPEELVLSADAKFLRIAFPTASGDGPTEYSVFRLSDGKIVGQGDFHTPFPANSNRVVVADLRQHRLAVWDYDEGKIIARLPRHRNRDKNGVPIDLTTALSDDGRILASASLDGLVRVWDLRQHQLLGELKISGEARALALNHTANLLAVGKTDGSIALIELPPLGQN